MNYRRGYYKKDGTYVQGHFVNKSLKKSKGRKTKKGCFGFAIITAIILITISCENDSECDSNCSDFSSQAAAQSAFESNRSCYSNLDRDNDGIACENNNN